MVFRFKAEHFKLTEAKGATSPICHSGLCAIATISIVGRAPSIVDDSRISITTPMRASNALIVSVTSSKSPISNE